MKKQMPNFFIIGAPKCGTTSLSSWLDQHPEVYMSVPKEPHYFNSDMSNRQYKTEKAYARLFSHAPDRVKAVGEASTWYLRSDAAIPAIMKRIPEARLIIMARDPAAMAASLFLHNKRHGHEDQPTFESAWKLQGRRAKGKNIPRMCRDYRFIMYGEACSIGSQIERVLNQVPLEKVHVICLSSMKAEPEKVFCGVQDFLGISRYLDICFSTENKAGEVRSQSILRLIRLLSPLKRLFGVRGGFGLAKFNERAATSPLVGESMRAELDEYFKEERTKLTRIFDRSVGIGLRHGN